MEVHNRNGSVWLGDNCLYALDLIVYMLIWLVYKLGMILYMPGIILSDRIDRFLIKEIFG